MYFSVIILFFCLGAIFGSFYNVVGYRLPRKESLLYPSSHCTNCNHKLGPFELIPILSFLLLGGKCKNCKNKISWFYPIFELLSGILFALSYVIFGFTFDCLLSIVFISMLLIIIVSDYQTMIIPDSILIVFSILIIVIKYFIGGFEGVGLSILNGIASFTFMFLIKLLGDFLFKKESMGGGDIKLMFLFGIVIGYPLCICDIFLATFIAFPVAVYTLFSRKDNLIPFGPFLAMAAILIHISKVDISEILNFFSK